MGEGEEDEFEENESSGKDAPCPLAMLQKGYLGLPPIALRGDPATVTHNGIIPGGGVEATGGRFFPARRLERLALAPPNSPRAVKPRHLWSALRRF